jgi:hypothetical protein
MRSAAGHRETQPGNGDSRFASLRRFRAISPPTAPAQPLQHHFEIMKAIDLEAALIGLALAVAWAAATIARTLLVPVVALLLTLAGWRPRPRSARIRPSEPPPVPAQPGRPIVDLTLAQLRGMVRQAGFKALVQCFHPCQAMNYFDPLRFKPGFRHLALTATEAGCGLALICPS